MAAVESTARPPGMLSSAVHLFSHNLESQLADVGTRQAFPSSSIRELDEEIGS